jgi:hypothetical protein
MTRDWEADFAAEVWAAAEGVHPRDPGALDPETETIIYRMERGDLRPLAAAICEEPHPALGYALLHLIESGRLRIRVVVGKGAPQRPDLFGRNGAMTLVRKPGNTGWQPGHAPSSPRPPEPPPSKGGGVPGQGPAIVRQPADPKHIHHAVYRWASPRLGAAIRGWSIRMCRTAIGGSMLGGGWRPRRRSDDRVGGVGDWP